MRGALAAASLLSLALTAPGATASPVLRGGFTAHAPQPDPTAVLGEHETCSPSLPGGWDQRVVTLPGDGRLHVVMTDFTGEWDARVADSRGRDVAVDSNFNAYLPGHPDPVRFTAYVWRPGRYTVIACNIAGGSTAEVSWAFTRR